MGHIVWSLTTFICGGIWWWFKQGLELLRAIITLQMLVIPPCLIGICCLPLFAPKPREFMYYQPYTYDIEPVPQPITVFDFAAKEDHANSWPHNSNAQSVSPFAR